MANGAKVGKAGTEQDQSHQEQRRKSRKESMDCHYVLRMYFLDCVETCTCSVVANLMESKAAVRERGILLDLWLALVSGTSRTGAPCS